MYHFAIVALLGLACWKFVGMALGVTNLKLSAAVRAFLTLAVGVLAATIIDYDVFGAWGVTLRNDWMGPVFTGLIVGSMSYVWHHVLGVVEAYGRHHRDQAREIEGRSPRAA
jgi:hypothetical protein